ncbi:MAG TPA: hypothetical protein VFA04_17125 [Bryobacteraceae bacterium]|nr:hypothetical protein [Bryobacteraceae bacterium]
MSAASPGAIPDTAVLDRLIREVADLQNRVRALEQQFAPQPAVQTAAVQPAARTDVHLEPNALPVLGKALLGIAGAYVLRALTDAGVLAHSAGITAGLLYALVWLFFAAKQPAGARFAVAVNAVTSVAVVAPLLWEASTRLSVVSYASCAAVLAAWALTGLALAWSRRNTLLAAIAAGAAALVSVAFLLATHHLLPFTAALLVIAAALEFEACSMRENRARWLTAVLADLAVLLLSWIVARPEGIPEGYAAVSPAAAFTVQLALIAIYGGSAVVQTLLLRRTFTGPETAQTAAAVLAGVAGASWLMAGAPRAMFALGLAALLTGAACYVVSFVLVPAANKWNFRAWAGFGLLLVVFGAFLPFSGSASWEFWCGGALICSWAAMAARKPTLGLHGAVYLVLAAITSGTAIRAAEQLFGAGRSISWPAVAVPGAAALLGWLAIDRSAAPESAPWRKQVSAFVFTAVIAWTGAGLALYVCSKAWPAGLRAPVDTLATVILTAISLALAWLGARTRRKHLIWVVYPLMVVAAWKIAVRDFPNEHNIALVISLLCYGRALMLLPRIIRARDDML